MRKDSNPNLRTLDLFSPRTVAVRPSAQPVLPTCQRGPAHSTLASLAGSGCSLRDIAKQVGLSHEAVRQRLQRSAAELSVSNLGLTARERETQRGPAAQVSAGPPLPNMK
jgi:DNA-binding NarL/FixJ family response regulator